MHFGTSLEDALEKAVKTRKGQKALTESQVSQKTSVIMARWLKEDEQETGQKKYRDPMAKMTRERSDA